MPIEPTSEEFRGEMPNEPTSEEMRNEMPIEPTSDEFRGEMPNELAFAEHPTFDGPTESKDYKVSYESGDTNESAGDNISGEFPIEPTITSAHMLPHITAEETSGDMKPSEQLEDEDEFEQYYKEAASQNTH
jgi:hypothetical protein